MFYYHHRQIFLNTKCIYLLPTGRCSKDKPVFRQTNEGKPAWADSFSKKKSIPNNEIDAHNNEYRKTKNYFRRRKKTNAKSVTIRYAV